MKNRSLEFRIQQKLQKRAASKKDDMIRVPVKGGKTALVPRKAFMDHKLKSDMKWLPALAGAATGYLGYKGRISYGKKVPSGFKGALAGGAIGLTSGALGTYLGNRLGGQILKSQVGKKHTPFELAMMESGFDLGKLSPEDVKRLNKRAGAADGMAEQSSHGLVSNSDNKERKQTYGEIWEKDDPGALGSPADANLIHYSDKQGDDNIYNGQPDPKDPEGREIRDAIKAKLVEYNSQNVDQAIADQTNDETDYL